MTQYAAIANALALVERFWIDEQPENGQTRRVNGRIGP